MLDRLHGLFLHRIALGCSLQPAFYLIFSRLQRVFGRIPPKQTALIIKIITLAAHKEPYDFRWSKINIEYILCQKQNECGFKEV